MNTDQKIAQILLINRIKKLVKYPYIKNTLKHLPEYEEKETALANFFINRNQNEDIFKDIKDLADKLEESNSNKNL